MYNEINLVTNKDSSSIKRSRLGKVRKVSYLLLFTIAVFSVLIFIINIRYSVNSVRQKQNSVMNNLSLYNDNIVKIIFLNLRLVDINSITSGRTNYQNTLEKFFANVPAGVEVQAFSMDNGKLNITLVSNSLLSLNEYLNESLKVADEEGLSDVRLASLTSQSSGYVMIIGMTFNP
ncbi:hypothetical protein E6Q11_04600 [Candidatus Dojkabacteria bacterium]|uniref:PilN domain-containing protein n=1 Tax=Candidatus Dojkabacteria bacterium TaxID=2099670 RepID=A0A5C7J4T4_9BACT|nr:MAG: hypothetical protein E6Q11_04600 [Candidatus Dojkabacteria bacterium]